jgi:hypothetical protein
VSIITLVGIDPGIVDTGAVTFFLDPDKLTLDVTAEKLLGSAPEPIEEYVKRNTRDRTFTFVEAYRDRGTVFNTHGTMRQIEAALRRSLPDVEILDNTGVKKVVTKPLMQLLNCWDFPTVTHHQDIRSAARIALYGGLKNTEINSYLTQIVMKQLGK